ncbi:MAG: response regulator transcription factor [Bacteroidia bacterium]
MTPTGYISIFIADDHQVVREGIRALLKENPDYVVCGEAKNGVEVLSKIAEMTSLPDLVLMDIHMPEMDGVECTQNIFGLYQGNIKVLALTMANKGVYIRKMLEAGASGYLLKDSDKEELYRAIYAIYKGNTYFSPQVGQTVMEEMMKISRPAQATDQSYLTKREIEVLKLIAKDLGNQEIADTLFISIRTVESHKQNLLIKTGANSVAGLIMYGIRNKLIDPE